MSESGPTNLTGGTGISIVGPTVNASGQIEFEVVNTAPSGGGTVSDVAQGTGISVSGGTGPTATVSLQTPVSIDNGGTGANTAALAGSAQGVVVVPASGTGSMGRISASTPGNILTSNAGFWVTLALDLTGGLTNLSGALVSTHGGTGVVSPTAHGVMIAEGASAMAVASPGAAGQLLTSNGSSADPTFQAPAPPLTSAQFSEHSSSSSSFTIATGGYTTLASFTVTVAAGQVVVLHGGVEVFGSASAGSYIYGVGVDSTNITGAVHRADFANTAEGCGAIAYLATGLSAGTHTINLIAGFATPGSGAVAGWSVVVQVLGS